MFNLIYNIYYSMKYSEFRGIQLKGFFNRKNRETIHKVLKHAIESKLFTMNELKKFKFIFHDKYMDPDHWHIVPKNDRLSVAGYVYPNMRKTIIGISFVNNETTLDDILFAVYHELGHYVDFNKGKLEALGNFIIFNGKIGENGVPFDMEHTHGLERHTIYTNLPHEVNANVFAVQIAKCKMPKDKFLKISYEVGLNGTYI